MDLPSTSHASLSDGFWFVLPEPAQGIVVWGSMFSGAERVYLDGEQVSERRTFRLRSEHRFTRDGADYTLTYGISSLLRGTVEVRLARDGAEVLRIGTRHTKEGMRRMFIEFLVLIALLLVPTVYFSWDGVPVGLAAGLAFLVSLRHTFTHLAFEEVSSDASG